MTNSVAAELYPFRFLCSRACYSSNQQLMVGSRYHELIESADSIVSMKEISTEVLGLLRNFPRACSIVLEQVRNMEH